MWTSLPPKVAKSGQLTSLALKHYIQIKKCGLLHHCVTIGFCFVFVFFKKCLSLSLEARESGKLDKRFPSTIYSHWPRQLLSPAKGWGGLSFKSCALYNSLITHTELIHLPHTSASISLVTRRAPPVDGLKKIKKKKVVTYCSWQSDRISPFRHVWQARAPRDSLAETLLTKQKAGTKNKCSSLD